MLVTTQGIAHDSEEHPSFGIFVRASLARFEKKDWGELCEQDQEMNKDYFVDKNRARLFAKYDIKSDMKDFCQEESIYIIREWDGFQDITTILYPGEY